jgi:hypothetical protein
VSEITLRDTDSADWDGLRCEAVRLKALGHSVAYIARLLQRNVKTITRILESEFRDRFANRQEKKTEYALELEWLKQLVKDRIVSSGAKWDRKDAELLLKMRDQESRLYGHDEPTQHQHQVTVELAEMDDSEIAAQLRQYNVSLPEGFLSLPAAPEQIEDAEFTPSPEPANEPQSGT